MKTIEAPSDELCDGDRDDDRQLEDEGDEEDGIVDDNGFVRQWDAEQRESTALQLGSTMKDLTDEINVKLHHDHRKHLAMAQRQVMGQMTHKDHHKHHKKALVHHKLHHKKHHHSKAAATHHSHKLV